MTISLASLGGGGAKEKRYERILSTLSWAPPAGVTYVIAHAMGGGGGGALGNSSAFNALNAAGTDFNTLEARGGTNGNNSGNFFNLTSGQANTGNHGAAGTNSSGAAQSGASATLCSQGFTVNPNSSITITVGAGGGSSASIGAGGSGFVELEYYIGA